MRLDWFILWPSGVETPQFLPFFGRHLLVSTVAGKLRKLNTGAQLGPTNVPLSNGIKIVSVLQRLLGEIVRTTSVVHKRDEQTNRQTN